MFVFDLLVHELARNWELVIVLFSGSLMPRWALGFNVLDHGTAADEIVAILKNSSTRSVSPLFVLALVDFWPVESRRVTCTAVPLFFSPSQTARFTKRLYRVAYLVYSNNSLRTNDHVESTSSGTVHLPGDLLISMMCTLGLDSTALLRCDWQTEGDLFGWSSL